MRTEILAIVFTDIKGYTAATSSQTHRENARMLHRIERIIAPVVRGYSGRVVKSIGDAYMIVFRSPTEAVRCAAAIQDRLHQHNASSRADEAIHIRIAMNLGEVRVHRGDVFGEPVNVAARIESITPANEIYFSHAIYLTMNRSQLPCERVGDFDLKGIPEPVTVYRARAFAHAGDAPEDEHGADTPAAGLPFGGMELGHWKKMRWVRRAYVAMWALVIAGVSGAGYLRYRPRVDYSAVLAHMKDLVDEAKPIDALAVAVEIPPDATQERLQARRLRRQAVLQLISVGNSDIVPRELDILIKEDGRDAEALLLRGVYLARQNQDLRGAIEDLTQSLKLNPALAKRAEVTAAVVKTYRDPNARRFAELIVETYLKQDAVPALNAALSDQSLDLKARLVIAARLEKLGAGQDVDWVALALEELKTTNCKTRLRAIAKLAAEGDERAVGPLMKVVSAKGCGASQAQRAINAVLGK